MDDDGLSGRFWLATVAICVAVGIAILLLFLLLDAVWYRWGILGVFIFFGGLLLLYAYLWDRRQAKRYEDMAA